MFKEMKKRIKNEKGLTLIELLAVIVILAIIAAIAIPAIGNIISKSEDKALVSEALNYVAGAKLAKIDGVCGDSATPCKNDTKGIGEYIEGAKGTFSISYSGTEWNITWDGLAEINNKTDYEFTGTAETTEAKLKASID